MAKKELMLTKNEIAAYVADAAQIERSAFTLEETAENYKKQGEELLAAAQNELNQINSNINDANKSIASANEELAAKAKEQKSVSGVLGNIAAFLAGIFYVVKEKLLWWIIAYVFGSIVFAVLIAFLDNTFAGSGVIGWIYENVGIVVPAFYAVVICLIAVIVANAAKNQPIKELKKMIAEEQSKRTYLLEQLKYKTIALENAKKSKELLDEEALQCRNAVSDIRDQLERYYSVGVIPMDYRTLDCLLVFNQIFKNDLAENMREAVDLYETRVYRGEVMKGIRNIYTKLENMNETMNYMLKDLREVQREVGSMNRDINNINARISVGELTLDRALRESRSAQYAANAVNESRERCADMIERYR